MRSSWKLKYLHRSLIRSILNRSVFSAESLFIYVRNSNLTNYLVNKEVFIYNGQSFRKLLVLKRLLNMKFGEFSFTKRKGAYIHNQD